MQIIVPGSIFVTYHIMPWGRKNPFEILPHFYAFPMAGIEPGPPVQLASALSITTLPLGLQKTTMQNEHFLNAWLKKSSLRIYWVKMDSSEKNIGLQLMRQQQWLGRCGD